MLITDAGETEVLPGMCAGFNAGQANAHHLVNKSHQRLVYLEVGDRSQGDEVSYPDDDLVAVKGSNGWQFQHKDGRIYPGKPTNAAILIKATSDETKTLLRRQTEQAQRLGLIQALGVI